IAGLDARTAAIAAESEALGVEMADAAANWRRSRNAPASAATPLRNAGERLRFADQTLSEAREQRARLEALRDSANQTLAELEREIRERVDAVPETLAALP